MINAYILKGSTKIVGRVIRNDLNEIIDQELKPGLTLAEVNEYPQGQLYEDDLITFAFKVVGDTHVPKDSTDYLEKAREKKKAEVLEEMEERVKLTTGWDFDHTADIMEFGEAILDYVIQRIVNIQSGTLSPELVSMKQHRNAKNAAFAVIDTLDLAAVEAYNKKTDPAWP